jgi:hypothetical protein
MPDPADELKRRIRRVFSFSGLPPEFLGASPKLRKGPQTFPEGSETSLAALETFQASSKTFPAPLKTTARAPGNVSGSLENVDGMTWELRPVPGGDPPQAPWPPARQAFVV